VFVVLVVALLVVVFVDVIVTNRSKFVFDQVDFVDNIIDMKYFPKLLFKYDYAIDTEPYLNISTIISFWVSKRSIGFSNLFRGILYSEKIRYNDSKHNVLNFAKLISKLGIDFKPCELVPLKYSLEDQKTIDEKLAPYKNKKIIGIHTGAAETSTWRMYKHNRFEKLINKILQENKETIVVLIGSNSEIQTINNFIRRITSQRLINMAGTTLGELAYLMTKFTVFVDNDTGPMHLSAAMKTKTIGLFGPNLPVRFGPFGNDNIAIYKAQNMKCSPCVHPHLGKFRKCPYKKKN
jgi:heptosyltransferase-2